jgi:transposase
MNEPLISGCDDRTIKEIHKMRMMGLPYKTIAHKIGFHKHTVTRWYRIYEKYGVKAFARSGDDSTGIQD